MIPKVCAHRGLKTKYLENTVEALQAAKRIGADMVEFDTMKTIDDVWVVHHDRHLGPEKLEIEQMRYDDVVTLKERDGMKIDVLEDVITKITGMHLNYEVKSKTFEAGVEFAKYLDQFEPKHTLNISSFNRNTLEGIYSVNRELKLAYLGYFLPYPRWIRFHRKIPLFSINPYIKFVSHRRVRRAHKNGLQVHTWTVNSDNDILRCFNDEVDVIITDQPEKCLEMRKEYFNLQSNQDITSQ